MKVLAVGGGSGGHVTPIVAVLKSLRSLEPEAEVRVWCDKSFSTQARSIISDYDSSIQVDVVASGKLRRYHHLTFWQHFTVKSLVLENTYDMLKVIGGFFQSLWKLIIWRPSVIFNKGGFVCLPVGLAAKVLRIPLVIHDSDAHPGLTNRILAKWANSIATGAPLDYYNYPVDRSHYVGIPVNEAFKPYTAKQKEAVKKTLGLDPVRPLVVVTGGGLGARRLNKATVEALPALTRFASVLLVSGAGEYDSLRKDHPSDTKYFQLKSFVKNMPEIVGAADVVVARAGATTILELAAANKPTILVPNAALTGGHQLKNAAVYEDANVAVVLDEDEVTADSGVLVKAIKGYIADEKTTKAMTKQFGKFAKPGAAKDVAELIISASN